MVGTDVCVRDRDWGRGGGRLSKGWNDVLWSDFANCTWRGRRELCEERSEVRTAVCRSGKPRVLLFGGDHSRLSVQIHFAVREVFSSFFFFFFFGELGGCTHRKGGGCTQ